MAKLDSSFAFTGSLGNLSAYTMRGVDKIVLRTKGGASKNKIKTSPVFANTRRVNAEFGGRAKACKFIMQALLPSKALADFNIAGPLIALLAPIQKLDHHSAFGQREVALSKNGKLLEGFSLNRQTPFDSIVRNTLVCTVSRDTQTAQIEIPALVPNINLFAPKSHAYYSFILTLGVVPDLFYTDHGYEPDHVDYRQLVTQSIRSAWYTVREGSAGTTLQVVLPSPLPNQSCTLLATAGICFGSPVGDNQIMQVKYAGSAKVCGVA